MLKHITILFMLISILSCDKKKSSISGKVTDQAGQPVYNALVNFIQCQENGDNCQELIIAQAYTSLDGEFIMDKKVGSKSKTKWITVYYNNKKVGQKDNVGLNNKNINIEVKL